MLRIASSTLAARKSGMIGALAAVGLAVILVVSCGILLESSMRAPIPVERLEAAGVVVEAAPAAAGEGNVDVSLPERAMLPASLATRLQGVPGVRAAIADRSFPLQLIDSGKLLTGPGDTPPVGHGWESAAFAPIVLTGGSRPSRRRRNRADLGPRRARWNRAGRPRLDRHSNPTRELPRRRYGRLAVRPELHA